MPIARWITDDCLDNRLEAITTMSRSHDQTTATTDHTGGPIRVLICDDHEMVRDALAAVIEREPDLEPVTCRGTAGDAITTIEHHDIDVAVLDVHLDHGTGIEVARWIRANRPTSRSLILTSFPSDQVIVDTYEAGASALVLKDSPAHHLVESIRDAHAGLRLLDSLTARAARQRIGIAPSLTIDDLDQVDRAILDMLADGSTDREIADEVHLNVQTIRNRVSRLLAKFDKANRTQLAVMIATLSRTGLAS